MRNVLETPEGLAERLAHSGLRPTEQRKVVYGVLLKNRNHPTADEVFAHIRSEMPSAAVSMATVYNCLETLVQCNLVRQVNFERGPTRYCPNLRPHAHFHDEATDTIHDIELPAGLLEQLHSILPPGHQANSVEIIFRGKSGPSS